MVPWSSWGHVGGTQPYSGGTQPLPSQQLLKTESVSLLNMRIWSPQPEAFWFSHCAYLRGSPGHWPGNLSPPLSPLGNGVTMVTGTGCARDLLEGH